MKAFMIAFSMYSKIPMPIFNWEEKDRKLAMCFFPLVGAAVGAAFCAAFLFLEQCGTGPLVRGAVLAAVPLLVTGGIHMDGFLDTCDARASYGGREKKLSILKDTHIGAFAAIYGGLWLVLYFAACAELEKRLLPVVCAGFLLSRALSGLAAALLPEARKQGMLADFMKDVNKKRTAAAMACYLAAAGVLMFLWDPFSAILALLAAALVFCYYWRMALREFGGVTGDLAGYFLQLCELAMLMAVAIGNGGRR